MLKTIDHEEKAIDRLVDDLKKENMEKFISIFSQQSQELETSFLELASLKDIDTAFGIWLDYLGALVGQPRNGDDDDDYRESLRVKIATNTSDGTPETMRSLIKSFTGATDVRITEGSVASGTIFLLDPLTAFDERLYRFVDAIKPAATNWIVQRDYRDRPSIDAIDFVWENLDGSFYEPSVRPDPTINTFAWEFDIDIVAAQAGEDIMQAGEPEAQAGNFSVSYTTDFDRAWRWKSYSEIPTQSISNANLFCDFYSGQLYDDSLGSNIWSSTSNLTWNGVTNRYEPDAGSVSLNLETTAEWITKFGQGYQPTQLQISLSTALIADPVTDLPLTCTVDVFCDGLVNIGTASPVFNTEGEAQTVIIDLDWTGQASSVNLQRIEFSNTVATEFPTIPCISFTED